MKNVSCFVLCAMLIMSLQQNITLHKTINNQPVTIKFVKQYELTGQLAVKGVKRDEFSFLCPVDYSVLTGELNTQNTVVFQDGRYLSVTAPNSFTSEYVTQNMYNNHVIPSNDNIALKLSEIKSGDIITLKGFLCDATWEKDQLKYTLSTSTSNTDTGNGACEVFYVQEVIRR